jgi:endonuclease/exonuclease/phosphatase family metal-dependent hydrolase
MRLIFKLFSCIIFFTISPVYTYGLKTPLRVMTFNIENGGSQIDFNQVVKAIKLSKADVVGIQEAWGNTQRLATALKWKYYDPQQHVISRFPLYKTDPQQKFVLVAVRPKQFIAIANLHLPDEPYGPDLISQGFKQSIVRVNEKKIRLIEAQPVIDQLALLAKQGIPVFLTGDFNSPSHLDWTKLTLLKSQNHRYIMDWPVTQYAANHGFIDSYRQFYPNPYKHPGYTWPANRPQIKNAIDAYNPSPQDLKDRIDFIFFSGPVRVLDSHILGEQQSPYVTDALSPWPSDHRAVSAYFDMTASNYPLKQMTLLPVGGENQQKPRIILSKKEQSVGEPVKIRWKNAPGYYYDYLSIAPINKSGKTGNEPVRLYLYGQINGLINYSSHNAQGNWPNW